MPQGVKAVPREGSASCMASRAGQGSGRLCLLIAFAMAALAFCVAKLEFMEVVVKNTKSPESARDTKVACKTALSLRIPEMRGLTEQEALAIVTKIADSSLDDDLKEDCVQALSRVASGATQAKPGFTLQKCESFEQYLTAKDWVVLQDPSTTLKVRLLALAHRMDLVALHRPSEKAVADIAAMAFQTSDAVVAAGVGALAAVRDLKAMLLRQPSDSPRDYPASPSKLQETHPRIYERAYADGGPVPCPIHAHILADARRRMPCRSSKTGYGLAQPAAPAALLPHQQHPSWAFAHALVPHMQPQTFALAPTPHQQLALANFPWHGGESSGSDKPAPPAPEQAQAAAPAKTVDTLGALTAKMRMSLGGSVEKEEEEEEEEDREEEEKKEEEQGEQNHNDKEGKVAHEAVPVQKRPAASQVQKRPAASQAGAPKKRPAASEASPACKRPAVPTETRGSLGFPGTRHKTPLHFGGSKVYTDTNNKRWRLYAKRGDRIETSYYWASYKTPRDCWNDLVKHLKRLNA